jgi:hypothetical protein
LNGLSKITHCKNILVASPCKPIQPFVSGGMAPSGLQVELKTDSFKALGALSIKIDAKVIY